MNEPKMKANDVPQKKRPRSDGGGEEKGNEPSKNQLNQQLNQQLNEKKQRERVAEGQEAYETTNRVNPSLLFSNGNHDAMMMNNGHTALNGHIVGAAISNQKLPPLPNPKSSNHTIFPTLANQGKNQSVHTQDGNRDRFPNISLNKFDENGVNAGSMNNILLHQQMQSKSPHTSLASSSFPLLDHQLNASSYGTTPTENSSMRQHQLPPLVTGSRSLQQDQQQLKISGGQRLSIPQTLGAAQHLLGMGGTINTAPSAGTASFSNSAQYGGISNNAFNSDNSSRALLEGAFSSHPSALMNLQQQKQESSTNGYFHQQQYHGMQMEEQRRINQLEEAVRRQAALRMDLVSRNMQVPPYQRGLDLQGLANLPNMINPSMPALGQDLQNRGAMHNHKNGNQYSNVSRADFTSNEEMRKSAKRQRIEDEQLLSMSGQMHLAHHQNHYNHQQPVEGLSIPTPGMMNSNPLIFTNHALSQQTRHATGEAPKTALKSRVFKTFQERFNDLLDYKAVNGHCNVPRRYGPDKSLGVWCNNIRYSYKQIQEGKQPHNSISADDIRRLDGIGFQWKLKVNAL